MPPRHGKSFCASIAFPAWLLGRDPTTRVMAVSYGEDLAGSLARSCMAVMTSPHPIAAAEINAIDAELGAKSHQAVSVLQTSATVLPRVAQEARTTLETNGPKVQELWVAWKVAERHRRDGSLLGI